MKYVIRSVWDRVCNVLFPEVCAVCAVNVVDRRILCRTCRHALVPVVSKEVSITPSISMNVFAISAYTSPLQKMVVAKHRGDYIAALQLGQLIWECTSVPFVPVDYVVPVPLHWTRKMWRGYNQSEVIAGIIARKRNVPVNHIVRRNRRTPLQRNKSHAQREHNVRRAFELCVDPEQIKGRHILLVDDVMTSGSTLRSVAREIVRYKPASIAAVVALRVV